MKWNETSIHRIWNRENKRLLLCTALALIAGLLAGYSLRLSQEASLEEPGVETGAIGLVSILPSADIMLETSFSSCGHSVERQLDTATYVGFSEAEMSNAFIDADITEFSAKRVRIRRMHTGWCPRHVLLKTGADGALHIYRTDETTLRQMELQRLSFEPSQLDESAASELTAGVAFDSVDEINAYLENAES